MEAEVITKVERLVREAEAKVVEIDGVQFTTVPLHDPRKSDPEPKPLVLHTLTGLVDYVTENRDVLNAAECMIHVVSPNRVDVVSRLKGAFQQRFIYATAETPNVAAGSPLFSFGAFCPTEQLIVVLQSLFKDDGDRADVLRLIGTVKDEVVRTEEDDGITQTVSARAGVTLKEEMNIPNPVTLTPFRTFGEVDQPSSLFVLRGQKGEPGVKFALFEAEGAAWELQAVKNISEWLKEKVGDFGILA